MSDDPVSKKTKPGAVSADRLKSFVERIEKLKEEAKAIGDDIRDVFSEAKGVGYDVKSLRRIIIRRGRDAADVAEEEAMFDVYLHALGMADEGTDALVDRRTNELLEEVEQVVKLTNSIDPPSIKSIMNALDCSMGKASKLRKLAVERIDLAISFSRNRGNNEIEIDPSPKSEKPGNGRPMGDKEREAYFKQQADKVLPEGATMTITATPGSALDRVAAVLEASHPGKVTRGVKVAAPVETQSEKLARVRAGKAIAGASTPNAGEATESPQQGASSPLIKGGKAATQPEAAGPQTDQTADRAASIPAHDPETGEIFQEEEGNGAEQEQGETSSTQAEGGAALDGRGRSSGGNLDDAGAAGDGREKGNGAPAGQARVTPGSVAAALLNADPVEPPDNSDIFDEVEQTDAQTVAIGAPEPIAPSATPDKDGRIGGLVEATNLSAEGVTVEETKTAAQLLAQAQIARMKRPTEEELKAASAGIGDALERARAKFAADKAKAAGEPDDLQIPAFLKRKV